MYVGAVVVLGDDEAVVVEAQLLHDGVDLRAHRRLDLASTAQHPDVVCK